MKHKKPFLIFQWILITALLTSCVIPISSNSRSPQSETKEAFGIRATLWTDHYCYLWSETIQIRFSLENTTRETIFLGGTNTLPIDLAMVRRTTSQYEMLWSETNSVPSSLELKPGESYEIEWDVPFTDKEQYIVYGRWAQTFTQPEVSLIIDRAQVCPESGIPSH